jgi:hypothetical protein
MIPVDVPIVGATASEMVEGVVVEAAADLAASA